MGSESRHRSPPYNSLIDEEHDGGVGYHAHQMCAETAVERLDSFLSDDKPECLRQTGVFDFAVHKWLP